MNKRFITPCLIVSLLTFIAFEIFVSNFLEKQYIFKLKEDLLIKANILKDLFPESGFDEFCKEYKKKTGLRITVISETGKVLGDSDEIAVNMDNHLNRPEIKEALLSGNGFSMRFSKTLNRELLYVALLIESQRGKRVLRLSTPFEKPAFEIMQVRIAIFIYTFLLLATLLFVWFYHVKRLRKGIREVIEFSEGLSSGKKDLMIFISKRSELTALARHVFDMTEKFNKKLEDARNERRNFELILKHLQEGLMIVDEKNAVLLINEGLKNLLNLEDLPSSGEDFAYEGKKSLEILRNAELIALMEEARNTNKMVSKEVSLNEDRYLYVTASPIVFSDNKRGMIMTFYDVTKLKKLEQVRRDFVANVAHEIKTPITAIKGFAETLIDGAIEDKENAIKFLDIIKRHSERLNSLVTDLLALSAIEQGEVKMEITEVNLSELIDSIFVLVESKAMAKGLYLKKSLPGGSKDEREDIVIEADRDKLFQILLNLVDNGIKFTDVGGVTIGIEREDDATVLFVEDTGCGIEKRHLQRLGERFYRIDRARSRELGGTGLGLAIVKHLVWLHGWDMKFESELSKGTKVKIFIYNSLTKG